MGGSKWRRLGTWARTSNGSRSWATSRSLHRGWSGFSNFAISFAIICVLAGCFTTYGQAWNGGGPIAISIGWPVISVLILTVAFSMSEIASAMPTAGGLYYWASKLGGPGWGWFTGWFNLIGLVAVSASVIYVSAQFLVTLLGLYNVNFIFNFASTNVHYAAHVVFAMFVIIIVVQGLINVFSSHLVSLFNNFSVWWNVVGVAVIVVLLIVVPSHHQSFNFVFGTRRNNTGFGMGMYWYYVLPLGFLLTMYTITGYDASAHLSEETHDAAMSSAKGPLAVGVLRRRSSATSCCSRSRSRRPTPRSSTPARTPALGIIESALSSAAAKAVILISTVGQLFCGIACVTSASRMTFAFSRDGAIPGHTLWRRLGANRTPTWSVLFVVVWAIIITIPAYFPNSAGYPVAFFAVTSVSVDRPLHRLHDSRVPALARGLERSKPARGRSATSTSG